jgi:hypothetical protein
MPHSPTVDTKATDSARLSFDLLLGGQVGIHFAILDLINED